MKHTCSTDRSLKLLQLIATFAIFGQMSLSIPVAGQVIQYPWPETAPVSDKYQVKVFYGEEEYNLHTHYSKPNLNVDPLHPNEGDGVTGFMEDRSLSYVSFAFEGEITIEVTKVYGSEAPRVVIAPKKFGINPTYFDGRVVRFKLKQEGDIPRYISVNFESDDNRDDDTNGGYNIKNGLMIFADRPEVNVPYTGNPGVVKYSNTANLSNADLIYFEPGDYDLTERFNTVPGQVGSMPLTKNGQKVYLAPGAFIRGTINAQGHDNIWIYGRGVLTGQDMAWHWIRDENDNKEAFVNLLGVDNARIDGIIVENPTHHTIPSGSNTTIKNLKIIGWASNHDGIRPGDGSVADGIFIKTSDDYDYARSPHIVKNSVFWPMTNGATGQLGWNNLGTGYAVYKNNILMNSEWRSYNRNRGFIGSVLEQGVNLQKDSIIDLTCEDFTAMIANITIEYDSNGDPLSNGAGEIKQFFFKNIKMEQPFLYPNGEMQKQPIHGFVKGEYKATIHDLTFLNLVVGNTLVTQDNYNDFFDLDPATTYNIKFETEGDLYLIRTYTTPGGKTVPEGPIDVPAGTDQVVSIIPDEGYRIGEVFVNGESKGRIQTVVFEDATQTNVVEVVFEEGDDYFDLESAPGGLLSKNRAGKILISPNPTERFVNIRSQDNTEITGVMVCSADGRVIRNKEGINTTGLFMDLGDLAQGIYFLRINSTNGFATKHIVIR